MLREAFPALPVRHLGYVRPQLLRLLMERATALVFFSLYEGFGIPLLEAFNVGTRSLQQYDEPSGDRWRCGIEL